MNSEVTAALIDIEAQLRQLGHWDKEPPSAEAFISDQPFSVDTLTLSTVAAICLFTHVISVVTRG